MCADFAQLGQLVQLDNAAFRAVKAATPGPYTFILPATKEVPRRLAHPRKKTVGVRIPDHPVVRALLRELGEPLLSSTLLLPGASEPMTDGWQIKEQLDHVVDAVVDSGDCGTEPTTVVDLSARRPRGGPGRRRRPLALRLTPAQRSARTPSSAVAGCRGAGTAETSGAGAAAATGSGVR